MKSNILITGGAGFIGSHLVEGLLNDTRITKIKVLDNLSTGSFDNIKEFVSSPNVEFILGDIRDYQTCLKACEGVDLISHQAALGSVPRSINDPLTTNAVNITGTLNIFTAAKENNVKRIVYAASSSTYGDHPDLPKIESKIGNPLSPYAVTKYVNELYACVYGNLFGIEHIGLRYFNVFGPRQNLYGPYAAVIPLFIDTILREGVPTINGDGLTSRDFTYVDNAVEANILALFTSNIEGLNHVYNVACGEQTSLNELIHILERISGKPILPTYGKPRKGDVLHSLADIQKIASLLGYTGKIKIEQGLEKTYEWYKNLFL